ncbi:restriction endonuclease subunit S [Verminephrobacter eiseniae]|nr:restriction endonuclease subunit S [Verminephrobacter sp. Larva24]MCW5233859.1 restriction endonuclease subunit S [Verminephrobacter eiseniae]MCW8184856.1 restriction endonuclease subunit S [Verminephrobacter eiseniae]MCW8223602.1 restriction endonuclease subunit S [Verminephrobacter eiseniae]MCW8234650.1 restriction endonuclease subunit S [Verminephrobacter eiseniae]
MLRPRHPAGRLRPLAGRSANPAQSTQRHLEPIARQRLKGKRMLLSNMDLVVTAPAGVAKLRELILSLAVQGRLVPQDPADEPASKLLQTIQEQKARLIAKGKIRRNKAQAKIAQHEKPFALPPGWEWVRLGALLPFRIGKTPASEDPQYWDQEGYAWVSISDMAHLGEVFDTQRKLTARGAQAFGYEPLPVGTLIMSFKLTIGKISVLRVPAYHNEAIVSLMPLCGLVTDFLKYMLPTVSKTGVSKEALMGTTLNTQSLSNLLIALPPAVEQSRIVARVEELMRLCDTLEARGPLEAAQHARLVDTLLGTLSGSNTPQELSAHWQRVRTHFDLLFDRPEAVDALEQTLLQLAVRGLLVPQDPGEEPASGLLQKICAEKDRLIAAGQLRPDKALAPLQAQEAPFRAPPGWEWARFGDVAAITSGVILGRKAAISAPVLLPYLRVANVQRWHLNLSSVKQVVIDQSELERFQIVRGDLLITEGGNRDKVGRTAIWRDELPVCLHQNHVFRVRGTSPDWNPVWAELYLNSVPARAYFAAASKQTTNLASINMTQLRLCAFPVPPLVEQARIVSRVEALRSLCADLRQRLSASQTVQTHLAEALLESVAR